MKNNSVEMFKLVNILIPSLVLIACVGGVSGMYCCANDFSHVFECSKSIATMCTNIGMFVFLFILCSYGDFIEDYMTGCNIFGLGMFLFGLFLIYLAMQFQSLFLFAVTSTLVCPIGEGFVVTACHKNIYHWFKRSKFMFLVYLSELISFVFGASIFTHLYNQFRIDFNVSNIFLVLFVFYSIVATLTINFFKKIND